MGSGPAPKTGVSVTAGWKRVQLSCHSVSNAASHGPRLNAPDGPPGEVAHPPIRTYVKNVSAQVIATVSAPFSVNFKSSCEGKKDK